VEQQKRRESQGMERSRGKAIGRYRMVAALCKWKVGSETIKESPDLCRAIIVLDGQATDHPGLDEARARNTRAGQEKG